MKDGELSAWRGSAAYLYTLRLDPVSLAWEYLRRNALYQAAWLVRSRRNNIQASSWGLKLWEDPGRDARSAEPIWWPSPTSSVVLTPASAGDAVSAFQLWRIPGQKSVVHDGDALRVTSKHPCGVTRAVLACDLAAGQPYAYQMSADPALDVRCRAVQAFDVSYGSLASARSLTPLRPTRAALMHGRILQAIDGAESGASHRDIAAAVFGWETVNAGWSPDGALRAQVRYFLKRGSALSGGGYRALLKLDSS